ncbi:MAG: hypothetical protein HY769_00610 [Candidatus Stahlbacteria bacterium]|nr:hypothetical protein [Candidatus Stahlbacteria bacterium]
MESKREKCSKTCILGGDLLNGIVEAKKVSWKPLSKIKCNKAEIVVKDKKANYCQFDSNATISISVKGPTRLKIRTRIELPEGFKGKEKYKIEVVKDGKQSKEFVISTEPSKVSSITGKKNTISKPKNVYLDVPSGTHKFSLRLTEPKNGIGYVRFYRTLRKLKYASFSPQTYSSVEKILVKEKERTYYKATKEKGVTVEVVGPTKLKVMTRLEFTPQMQGEQTYGLQVIEGEKKEFTFKTKKSDVSSSASKGQYTPGVGKTVLLSVPKGTHKYEFKPIGANSILLRLFIPEKDVGKGGKK